MVHMALSTGRVMYLGKAEGPPVLSKVVRHKQTNIWKILRICLKRGKPRRSRGRLNNWILKRDYSNESYWAVLCCGAVYYDEYKVAPVTTFFSLRINLQMELNRTFLWCMLFLELHKVVLTIVSVDKTLRVWPFSAALSFMLFIVPHKVVLTILSVSKTLTVWLFSWTLYIFYVLLFIVLHKVVLTIVSVNETLLNGVTIQWSIIHAC